MMVKRLIGLLYLSVVSGNMTHVWQEPIFNVPNLKSICENFKNVTNINVTCVEQLNIVCENYTLFLTMLDASSSLPYSGLGYASKTDLGNFDQCLTIDHNYKNGRILGEYCLEGLIMPDKFGNISDANTFYIVSLCRPNGCNSDAYNAIVSDLIDPYLPAVFMDDRCQSAETSRTLATMDIVTLAIFGTVVWLMLISTFYDFHYVHKKQCSAHPFLVAFSVFSNGKKLFHIPKNSVSKEQIAVFSGLRVISMMWIVAGHGFIGWDIVTTANREKYGENWPKQFYAGYITTAYLGVDTFFYMSGFLTAFQYLKNRQKPLMKHILGVPKMYIHRYIRLTIPLLMVYLVVISIFELMGSGPLWDRTTNATQKCKENWWAFFLYIQNYHNYEHLCIVQTWFMSAVVQMFFLSPLVLIPLSYILTRPFGFKKSMVILMILNVICTFIPLVHKMMVRKYDNIYDTHSRLIDYSIGMTLGMFMREKISEPFLYMAEERRRSIINRVTWTLTLIVMIITVLGFQLVEMHDSNTVRLIYHTIARPVWCTALSWITYSCYHGYGGSINWILCRPIFHILGKFTYGMYILHQSVIDYQVRSARVPWYFTDYNAFYLYCGHFVVSLGFAIFWVLAFESPILILEKYFTKKEDRILEQEIVEPQKYKVKEIQHNVEFSQNRNNIFVQNVEAKGLYKEKNELE